MSVVTKSGTVSLASVLPPQNDQIAGLLAGEAIANGDLCYIKSDGKVWLANGTAATAPALFDGIYVGAYAVAAGDPITIHQDVTVRYGSGLTPGARYYLAATAGALDTAATTGGTVAIAKAIDATRIKILAPGR